MALITCPECGREISDRAVCCPHCGYPIAQEITSPIVPIELNDNLSQHESIPNNKKEPVKEKKFFEYRQLLSLFKNKKLNIRKCILIGIIGVVLLSYVFIFIPNMKCNNSQKEITPFLSYIGIPHPNKNEAIKLSQEDYDNSNDVTFMGMKGEISFQTKKGYVCSCTWTSLDSCSEEQYLDFANNLQRYFENEPKAQVKNHGNYKTYHYLWTDPNSGHSVTMRHGLESYDQKGKIEIEWETTATVCDILGHKWSEATCVKARTCSECKKTEGNPSGHKAGEWSEWDIDYNSAIKSQELSCIICEDIIETKSEPITTFVDKNYFTIYPHAFAKRFEESSRLLNGIDYSIKSEYAYEMPVYSKDNYVYYRIQDKNHSYADIGIMSFINPDGDTLSVINDYSTNSFDCINILIEDSYDVSAVVYASLLAIDPDIGYSEAAEIGQNIVDNIALSDTEDFKGLDYNGINYLLYKDRRYHYLFISIDN